MTVTTYRGRGVALVCARAWPLGLERRDAVTADPPAEAASRRLRRGEAGRREGSPTRRAGARGGVRLRPHCVLISGIVRPTLSDAGGTGVTETAESEAAGQQGPWTVHLGRLGASRALRGVGLLQARRRGTALGGPWGGRTRGPRRPRGGRGGRLSRRSPRGCSPGPAVPWLVHQDHRGQLKDSDHAIKQGC